MTQDQLNLANDIQTDLRQLEDDKSKFKASIEFFERGENFQSNKYMTISVNTRFLTKVQVMEYINNINNIIQEKTNQFHNL